MLLRSRLRRPAVSSRPSGQPGEQRMLGGRQGPAIRVLPWFRRSNHFRWVEFREHEDRRHRPRRGGVQLKDVAPRGIILAYIVSLPSPGFRNGAEGISRWLMVKKG